jgi:hypothetical protein
LLPGILLGKHQNNCYSRAVSEPEPDITLSVDPENMAARIFHLRPINERQAFLTNSIILDTISADPAFKSFDFDYDFNDTRSDLTVELNDASDWMSSTSLEFGTSRQDFLRQKLGQIAMVKL